jgi:uncharacterized membrane protein YjjP (DUF1212 family)
MRRIGYHGNDLDGVALFTDLSRRICAQRPDPEEAMILLEQTRRSRNQHHWAVILFGYFLAAGGFSVFFGGNLLDGLAGGLAGVLVGICQMFMDRLKTNPFFQTMLSAIPLALIPYALGAFGIIPNPDAAVIGTVMVLIPGLLFTNAMRDIIFGDTNSGTNRIVQVLLIAVAIACGTGAAWQTAAALWGEPASLPAIDHSFWVQALPCFIGGIGFSLIFNIHGPGMLLCALGGTISWGVYRLTMYLGGTDLNAFFWSCMTASVYSEIMARVRKYPAIGYLLVSIFPMIPGAGVYYTMNYALRGQMDLFAQQGMHTIAVAGVMAVSILLVSTTVRLHTDYKRRLQHKKPLK